MYQNVEDCYHFAKDCYYNVKDRYQNVRDIVFRFLGFKLVTEIWIWTKRMGNITNFAQLPRNYTTECLTLNSCAEKNHGAAHERISLEMDCSFCINRIPYRILRNRFTFLTKPLGNQVHSLPKSFRIEFRINRVLYLIVRKSIKTFPNLVQT